MYRHLTEWWWLKKAAKPYMYLVVLPTYQRILKLQLTKLPIVAPLPGTQHPCWALSLGNYGKLN